MAKIIDVRGTGGQLVVLGSSLALPTANTTVFSNNAPIVAGSVRFNPDLNRVEYIGTDDELWSDIAGVKSVVLDSTTLFSITTKHASSYIRFTNSSAVLVSLPSDANAIPIGSEIDIVQVGTGKVTIQPVSGVVINTPSTKSTRTRYSRITLTKVGASDWDLSGDLALS